MPGLTIEKRGGTKESWSDDKIITSMIRAGADIKNAQKVVSKIKSDLAQTKTTEISSPDLRDKVIVELSKVDSLSAQTYKDYKKA